MTTTVVSHVDDASARETASAVVRARFDASNRVCEAFFAAESDAIARACQAMAERFRTGGRLLVHAPPSRRSDVSHVVVEFMHPVVVGKRALGALALEGEGQLALLGRPNDIVLVLADGAPDAAARSLMTGARGSGMLCLVMAGRSALGGRASGGADSDGAPAGFEFVVASGDACIVQEVHEMLYHVLWELVHVFLDRSEPAA